MPTYFKLIIYFSLIDPNEIKVTHEISLFLVFKPDPFFDSRIWEENLAASVPLAIVELAFVDVTILQVLLAFALL